MNRAINNNVNLLSKIAQSRHRNKIIRRIEQRLNPLIHALLRHYKEIARNTKGIHSDQVWCWPTVIGEAVEPGSSHKKRYGEIRNMLQWFADYAGLMRPRLAFRSTLSSNIGLAFDWTLIDELCECHLGKSANVEVRVMMIVNESLEDICFSLDVRKLDHFLASELEIIDAKLEERMVEVMTWAALRT